MEEEKGPAYIKVRELGSRSLGWMSSLGPNRGRWGNFCLGGLNWKLSLSLCHYLEWQELPAKDAVLTFLLLSSPHRVFFWTLASIVKVKWEFSLSFFAASTRKLFKQKWLFFCARRLSLTTDVEFLLVLVSYILLPLCGYLLISFRSETWK